jgi:hypothetical protein
MHFGPEWMRNKQPPSRTQPDPSPPPTVNASPGASTYSALVSPAVVSQPEKRDESHPFRYSKEDLLKIYKDSSGKGGLGLEVERWEGVVREVGSEPIALREMSEAEKKVCHFLVLPWRGLTPASFSYSLALSIPTCVDVNLVIFFPLSRLRLIAVNDSEAIIAIPLLGVPCGNASVLSCDAEMAQVIVAVSRRIVY